MQQKLSTGYQRLKLGARFSANRAKRLGNPLMNPPDAKFQEVLETILTPVKGVSAGIRLSNAESLVLTWLDDNGKFIRTPEGELFYLWHDKHRLFELDTELWHAWLHELTGVNPASTGFSVLSNACKTAAILNSEIKNVVRMAYYDNDTKLLWVSKFDGKCYCLDGNSITLKVNGDGPVIFDDLHIWEPYEPDYRSTTTRSTVAEIPNWAKTKYSWAYQVWSQSLFFNELCPTKPMMVLLGEKGSGKSMALRLLLRLLFGQWAQVSGVPVKPDDFSVTASHYHLYAMDNLDTLEPWLQGQAGQNFHRRDGRIPEGVIYLQRNSRDPQIPLLDCGDSEDARYPERDDLRIDCCYFLSTALMMMTANENRYSCKKLTSCETPGGGYADKLELSSERNFKDGDLPAYSTLRMADWEALGRLMTTKGRQSRLVG